MENEDTIYKQGNPDDFINFIFSNKPKEKNSVKLELGRCENNIKIGAYFVPDSSVIDVGKWSDFNKLNIKKD